jgi:hypothetical protein
VSNLPAWMSAQGGANAAASASAADTSSNANANANASVQEQAESDPNNANSRKRKFVPSEANRDLNARKQRIDAGDGDGGPSMAEIRAANEAADRRKEALLRSTKEDILKPAVTFPPVPAGAVARMRQYVTDQIVELLGEAEDSMIGFVLGALTAPTSPGGCLVSSLLEEMQPVLDEDAEDFVVDLYRTVAGLS